MTQEIYVVVPDTEGMYAVSNLGNVKNIATGYVLSPFMTDRGYLQVAIQFSTRDRRITINVHKLVARAFLGEPPLAKPYVNHIDGCKTNNAVNNLEYVSPRENNEHAVAAGLIAVGEEARLSVLKESQVRVIIEKLRAGERNIDLAREFGVEHNTIDDIRKNRTWRHIEREAIQGNGPKKKLTEDDVRWIKEKLTTMTNKEISSVFSVAPATIDQIRKGNTWKHI